MENVLSIFADMVTPVEAMTLKEIHEVICSEYFRNETDQLRLLLKEGNKEAFNNQKKNLIAVTFSGRFERGRKLENLVEYTQLICLDFDKIPSPEELEKIKQIVKGLPFTRLMFTSPSGKGLKVVVEVNSNQEEHKLVYAQVASYYESQIGYKADHTTDISRLCFLCHDKEAFFDESSEVFAYKPENKTSKVHMKPERVEEAVDCQAREIFEYAVKFTEKVIQFEEGKRNRFVFTLANNCNKWGLCEEFVSDLCVQQYAEDGFNEYEIEKTVHSSYSATEKFNIWKRPFKVTQEVAGPSRLSTVVEEFKNDISPFFDDGIYNELPSLIRDVSELFTERREKDMFLLSFITLLSGALHNINGWYNDDKLYANLYTLLIAPSASGKRVMSKAMDIFAWLDAIKKPNYAPLISINGTFKSTINKLSKSNGIGILYDDEIEALSKFLKHDKNGMSFILKQGYDNRMLRNGRIASGQQIIELPKFSFLTAGNAHQLSDVVQSITDGAYSRHLYYTFNEPIPFYDVKPGLWKDFVEEREGYLEQLSEFIDFTLTYPFEFSLTDEHFENIRRNGLAQQQQFNVNLNSHMDQVIKRSGRSIFKIAMLLSAFRKWTNGDVGERYICHNSDFHTAISIIGTLVTHSQVAGEILKNEGKPVVSGAGYRKDKILEVVPDCFTKQEAETAMKEQGINVSGRTVYNDLQELVQKGALIHEHNKYCKQALQ